ncbi:hypothetical protein AGR8A_pAt30024 [Agrobacterium fabrum str. J-07]|nr:hypothetical protein AGR8A_pAt30024 [Agrobacterium fabrum str. J-07]
MLDPVSHGVADTRADGLAEHTLFIAVAYRNQSHLLSPRGQSDPGSVTFQLCRNTTL